MSDQLTIPQIDPRLGGTSASSAEPDLRCPGRHLAQKSFRKPEAPEAPGNKKYSDHGRVIHEALAEKAGDTVLQSLTVDQRDTFDRCRSIEKKFCLSIFPDQGKEHPVSVIREKRFWVMVDGKYLHSGQPDVVFYSGSKGAIVEYKTLPGDVPTAPTNLQIRDQVVLISGALKLSEIFAIVDQPLVTMSPVPVRYTAEEIKRAELEMFERVRRSNDPNSPRLAGEVQCEHCLAKFDCAEYNRFAGSVVPGMLSLLDVPVSAWTPQQRGFFCNQKSIAKKWLDETEEALKAGAAADPAFIEGWCLGEPVERRTIVDPQSVFTRFAALGGTAPKFMRCVTVSFTKLREAINDLTGARGKALAAAVDTLTEGLVETKLQSPSLKRKEDSK